MPRLIDADALKNIHYVTPRNYDSMAYLRGVSDVYEIISKLPTVDAVKVVRCKDCVLHGLCKIERAFNADLYENPLCAAGVRWEDAP